MKKINTLLIFILLFTSILCYAYTVNDSMKVNESSTDQNHVTNNGNKILDWLKDNLGIVITSIVAILSALIGGYFVIKAKKIEVRSNRAQEELKRELARLEALSIHQEKEKIRELKTEEDRYLNFIINENETLTFHGFESKVKVPILLWDVYIPLRVNAAGARMEHDEIDVDDTCDDHGVKSVEEAINFISNRNYKGLLILGDPGAGKTTLLKYFLLCFAKKEATQRLHVSGDYLPILLPLRTVDLNSNFLDSLCANLDEYDLDLSKEFFTDRLDHGQAIIMLDGLDEVVTEADRIQMCKWIEKTQKRYHKCPFIITSRFTGYRGDVQLPETFLKLNAHDFEKGDIQKFLHSWYTAVETALHGDDNQWRTKARNAAETLYNKLVENPDYLKLAINPLMLQLIALVHYDFRTIPDRRVELYEQCIDLLLEKWDKARGLDVLLSAKEARQVLQPLALWLHSIDNRRYETKEKLIEQITPNLQTVKPGLDAETFLTSIRDRSGLFEGKGTEEYGFHHLSFQEYLTAEEIRNKSKTDILVQHFDESWWREPTLLALGLANPTIFEPFMNQFLVSDKNNGAAADFMLRCINEALKKSENPFEKILFDSNLPWEKRYNALLCLEVIESDIAKKIVKQVQNDKRPEIANKAQQMLIQWGMITAEDIVEKDITTGLPKRIYSPLEKNAEYILIPGGSYTLGKLEKKVTVAPFYMAKYPVTNLLYRIFIKKTGHEKPVFFDEKRFNSDDQPVVGVTWHDAVAYCKWLSVANGNGKIFRLPKGEEWECAAGDGTRTYPWGEDKPTDEHANWRGKIGQTTPVGSYPKGATPEGLLDMAGNVLEWTDSWYDEKKANRRMLRGGSWLDCSEYQLRCSFRDFGNPSKGVNFRGFRCVQALRNS